MQGSDGAAGTSASTAWRTLTRASRADYAPGDSLLLQYAGVWIDESLVLGNASGVTVGAWGNSSLPRPSIEQARPVAPEDAGTCMTVPSPSSFTLSDIAFSGCATGLDITWAEGSVASGITLSNLYFRDIRPPLDRFTPGVPPGWAVAISMSGGGNISDVKLVNSLGNRIDVFFRVDGSLKINGITLDSNTVENCGGNCIGLGPQLSGMVMSNSVFLRDRPDRMFAYGTTDVIFGNIVGGEIRDCDFNSRSETEGGPDGCSVDFETSADNTAIRGCYFYHSYGSGVMIFGHATTSHGIVLSDNVFIDSGSYQMRNDRGGIAVICPNGNKPSALVANSTFITSPGTPAIFPNPAVKGCESNLTLQNNTFANTTDPPIVVEQPRLALGPSSTRSPKIPIIAKSPTEGAVVRYTTDGSRPTASSPVLPSGFALPWPGPATAVLFRAFKDGMVPSVTNGHILERNYPWTPSTLSMRGNTDGIFPQDGSACIRGWAVDPIMEGGGVPPVSITIVVDDDRMTPYATIVANTPRPDLPKAGEAPNADHGLDLCLPKSYWTGTLSKGKHNVTLYATGTPMTTPYHWKLPESPICLSDGATVDC